MIAVVSKGEKSGIIGIWSGEEPLEQRKEEKGALGDFVHLCLFHRDPFGYVLSTVGNHDRNDI